MDLALATERSINEALAAYSEARRELTEFDMEFSPILAQRTTLEEELKAAQAQLTAAMAGQNIDFVEDGDFGVTLVRSKSFDTKQTVQNLIDAGVITNKQWVQALVQVQRAPYIKATIRRG